MSRTKSYAYVCIVCRKPGRSPFRSACICEPCARLSVPEYRQLPHHAERRASPARVAQLFGDLPKDGEG